METFSALLAICAGNSPASGEFPAQRPVTLSFDVFFDLCLNKRLRKQSWGWWFDTLSRPWLHHCNEMHDVFQGLYSLNGRTSYRKMLWSLESARCWFRLFQSLWNSTGISAALCRGACQISERCNYYNIQSRGFETSRNLAERRLTA